MSSIPNVDSPLKPTYLPSPSSQESASTSTLIQTLHLSTHIEGGYFSELDRNPLTIPTPFPQPTHATTSMTTPLSGSPALRNASTSIFYLLTPVTPQGHFHRNQGRTVHTVVEGRGRYVVIHADEEGGKKRVESFVVGKDVARGERAVWIVEGGKYKASFLLAGGGEGKGDRETDRLLISETVVPGFEYVDHDFLRVERFQELVTEEQAAELEWLVRRE